MDYLSLIRKPIEQELEDFVERFNGSLDHGDDLLSQALSHIRRQGGKRMRPMLILLMAKNFGRISSVTQHAAVGLELLHTASLIHDDVVDESSTRRGQSSVNDCFNNKVAVLVGDYVLSTALLEVSFTHSEAIVRCVAELGRTLSSGEILQLSNIRNAGFSEDVYFEVIKRKTAALFEACAAVGAESTGATADQVAAARRFGQTVGLIFQIRDDIFDYYDAADIGKPTGNDMTEGKLTLPVLYALQHTSDRQMVALANKVKEGTVTSDEIATLVRFAKESGGIEYAERCMKDLHRGAQSFLTDFVQDETIRKAMKAYLDFVIERKN